jgi:ElaB/YqjD/DUF883 family membrane-anchored ribosome-binding protein
MSTTSEQMGTEVKKVAEDVQAMGATVRDAAQEKLGQAGDKAAEYVEQARDKIHGGTCACSQFLRERPLTAVLLAAGIGWLLGRFWKHR